MLCRWAVVKRLLYDMKLVQYAVGFPNRGLYGEGMETMDFSCRVFLPRGVGLGVCRAQAVHGIRGAGRLPPQEGCECFISYSTIKALPWWDSNP